jgi:hypothetical protein|tara:strand:- start:1836 stop:2069 length:234 start_codon:yes stop_codon:yes gene_type:complete
MNNLPERFKKINEEKYIKFNTKKQIKMEQPDASKHQIVSFVKSTIRIIGYCFLPFNLIAATILLILSEIVGIVEEMV